MELENKFTPYEIFQNDLSTKGIVYAVFRYISGGEQDLRILDSKVVNSDLSSFLDKVKEYYKISNPFDLAKKCKELNDGPYEIEIDNSGAISIKGTDPKTLTGAFESTYKEDEFGDIHISRLRHTRDNYPEFKRSTYYKYTSVIYREEWGECYCVRIGNDYYWKDSFIYSAGAFNSPTDDLKELLKDFPPIIPYCLIVIAPKTIAIRDPKDPTSLSNAKILKRDCDMCEIPSLIQGLEPDFIQKLIESRELNEYYLELRIRNLLSEKDKGSADGSDFTAQYNEIMAELVKLLGDERAAVQFFKFIETEHDYEKREDSSRDEYRLIAKIKEALFGYSFAKQTLTQNTIELARLRRLHQNLIDIYSKKSDYEKDL